MIPVPKIIVAILFSALSTFLLFPDKVQARNYRSGDVFKGNQEYTIQRLLGLGGAGKIYLAQSNITGKYFAIKFIRDDIDENDRIRKLHASLKNFLEKHFGNQFGNLSFPELAAAAEDIAMKTIRRYDVPHAKILESGEGYRIKEFLGNATGSTFLYNAFNTSSRDTEFKTEKLLELIDFLISHKLGPIDFKPSNVMWFNSKWHIIDLIAMLEMDTYEAASKTIKEQLRTHWNISVEGKSVNILNKLPTLK